MKDLFKPQNFKTFLIYLLLLLIVKLVWFLVEVVWLSASGVEYIEQKSIKPLYYRVKLTPNEIPVPKKQISKKVVKAVKVIDSMKGIRLLAIYNASDTTVVTVEYKKKTKVLSKGDTINGFVLDGAGGNYATFSKNAKIYTIALFEGEKGVGEVTFSSYYDTNTLSKRSFDLLHGDVIDAGDHKIIDKSLIKHYAQSIDDIYKNIGIADIRKGNELQFRISFIRKGSPFAKLGLKRGDIIKSINGQEINSYNAAFTMYKNIQNIDNLTLVIIRGEEEMELEYEIN